LNNRLAMHETLDLHELINMKVVSASKFSSMSTMVSDPSLRNMLQQDVQMCTQHVQQLSNLLSTDTTGTGGRF
jgi:similar to spore coat protein